MVNLLVTFKNLSRPVRWSTIAYISCLFGYNVIGTYVDAKNYLNKYRSGEINKSKHNEEEDIKSEWDAVKFGAQYNAFKRLYDSIIWPISVAENIIPTIVLALNPPPVNSVKTDEPVKKN
jgi:hypothetical protein